MAIPPPMKYLLPYLIIFTTFLFGNPIYGQVETQLFAKNIKNIYSIGNSLSIKKPKLIVDSLLRTDTTLKSNPNLPQAEKVPFSDIETNWQNGSDRRDSSVLAGKYFTPAVMLDINYTYSFNNPNDNTVVGSTVLARDNEVQLGSLNFGGDLKYGNARGRIMMQFGARTELVPRNDLSVYRGQYNLASIYKNLSEAYAGYHFNKWYGINVDAGLFLSYIGLNSYYQVENWEYQASFTSDNTPWFFNGLRVQIFPTAHLKLEYWIVNGWQSYGRFNKIPGFGTNVTYNPTSNFKILTNDYLGTDSPDNSDRLRFHSDNSLLYRYFNRPSSARISKMAFSLTGDLGFEKGGGVNGFANGDSIQGPAQYFLSLMFYNRIWFLKDRFAFTCGGGLMTNPGRYLVLYPTGQASPLPDPNNPTQTEGKFPFSANPGDPFKAWDCSANMDWLPSKNFAFRVEYVFRHSNIPYFAGPGGVTSPNGYTTTPLPPDWRPDLRKTEGRVILALLFRI